MLSFLVMAGVRGQVITPKYVKGHVQVGASRAAAPGSGGGGRRVHHLEEESFGVKEQRKGSI